MSISTLDAVKRALINRSNSNYEHVVKTSRVSASRGRSVEFSHQDILIENL